MDVRTDLAIENREMYHESHDDRVEIPGVKVNVRDISEDIKVTSIEITDKKGSDIMGKPCGSYITIEAGKVIGCESEYKKEVARVLASELSKLIPFDYHLKVLVAGLGNEKITPDSLGPVTVDKIKITRHYFILFDEDGDDEMSCVCAINPGVMGTTGIESAELIKRAAQIAKPDVIIAIDSLAARNIDRISSTIQISDTGISPGAGTGNMRKALNQDTTGVRVVAVGVPTVIDAKTIIIDAFREKFSGKKKHGNKNNTGKSVDERLFEKKILDSAKLDMIVTSSEIDQVIRDFSDIISEAVNISLHPGIYS